MKLCNHLPVLKIQFIVRAYGLNDFTLLDHGPNSAPISLHECINIGDSFYYTAGDEGNCNWEIGLGELYSTENISRKEIVLSSIGSSKVYFQGGDNILLNIEIGGAIYTRRIR